MLKQRQAEKAKIEEFLTTPKVKVEDLVYNPIQCSYFLKFCKQGKAIIVAHSRFLTASHTIFLIMMNLFFFQRSSNEFFRLFIGLFVEFSEENLEFVMAIQKYSDNLSTRDKNGWLYRPYTEIDEETGVLLDLEKVYDIDLENFYESNQKNTTWPSRIVIRDWVEKDVVRLWNKYLSNDSPNQICMPSKVLINTIKRLKLLHIYGPRVFDEALIDPQFTLGRDILPRFVSSPVYKDLRVHLTSLLDLPDSASLAATAPEQSRITPARCAFLNISAAMEDRVVYEELLAYMQGLYAAENILAVRMIRNFRAMWVADVIDPGTSGRPGVSARPGASTPASSDSVTVFKRTKTPAEMQLINDFGWTIYRYITPPIHNPFLHSSISVP